MQPDLPWNVAGIPPEAREAARAAARREGLSVGEWLTRNILRTMAEPAMSNNGAVETWQGPAMSSALAYRNAAETAAQATRETEDMLARVSRSEDESHGAFKRIEDQLRGVARRLDAAERSQAESNRAMSKAAAEINVAAREQAQAFDQLDGHVATLSARLSRVEQFAQAASLKDAVKGLHTGLSRVADQIADTASRSAGQISLLAQNVETLANRLTQTREEAKAAALQVQDHLGGFESRLKAIEETAPEARQLQEQLSGLAGRLRQLEAAETPASALKDVHHALEAITERMADAEASYSGTMARLEGGFARLEERIDDPALDVRLAALEESLAALVNRGERASVAQALSEELHQLSERIDALDDRHRRDLAELREALEAAEAARNAAPSAMRAVLSPPETAQAAVPPDPPLPSFLQSKPVPSRAGQPVAEPAAEPEPLATQPGPDSASTAAEEGFDASLFAVQNEGGAPATEDVPPTADSYLASLRRQLRSMPEEAPAESAEYRWTPPVREERGGGGRIALIVAGAILLIATVAALLFFTFMRHPMPVRIPAALSGAPSPAHQPLPHPATTQPAVPAPQTRAATAQPASAEPKPDTMTLPPQARMAAGKTAAVTADQIAKPSRFERLKAAAADGDVKAETALGLSYLDGDGVAVNEAEGARWLEHAAKAGQPVAQYRLGTLYERGYGVPADPKLADDWYEAAAKQGNRKAMHNLAVAYAQGAGVTRDFAAAAQWFRKAADLGLRDSQFNLAVLYERGMGVQQSLVEAYKWYAIAAAGGDTESKARVAAIASQLTPGERVIAEHAAETFRPATPITAANIPPAGV